MPARCPGAALEVLYRRVPDALRYRLITEVLNEATRGEIDLRDSGWRASGPAKSSGLS